MYNVQVRNYRMFYKITSSFTILFQSKKNIFSNYNKPRSQMFCDLGNNNKKVVFKKNGLCIILHAST